MPTEMRFTDPDLQVADAVLRLAARGRVKSGEKDGRLLVRSPDRVRHPGFGTWTRQFLVGLRMQRWGSSWGPSWS